MNFYLYKIYNICNKYEYIYTYTYIYPIWAVYALPPIQPTQKTFSDCEEKICDLICT